MNKFKGFPSVFYLTKPENIKLQEYTELNLEKNKIFQFTKRCSQNNYSYNDELTFSILIIDTLKEWLENTSEKWMILMSDNVDFDYVEYFHFDWEYLMNNIPHDVDSLQLGFEDKLQILPCFLHPVKDSHGFGMTLLTRNYAQKLVKLHYVDGKYFFHHKISNAFWKSEDNFVTPHYFLNQNGRCYSLPMFPRNPEITKDKYFTKEILKNHKKLYFLWWKKYRDTRTLQQFFSYFSDKDFYITLNNTDLV